MEENSSGAGEPTATISMTWTVIANTDIELRILKHISHTTTPLFLDDGG